MKSLSKVNFYITRRFLSQKSDLKKSFYITTPIFYVNAAPHLGHLYSMVLCDTRHRWELLKNQPSYFTTGTDEHGLKIQTAAAAKDIAPKLFTDQVSQNFKQLTSLANIKYDRFIRTTDPDHLEAVNKFWKIVNDNGYIYEGEHSGWYSISDETFYTENQIEEKLVGGKPVMVSKETGTVVQLEKEKNYFFKLSTFKEDLINHFKSNPDFVLPKQKYLEILASLENEPLNDLSISRPSSRLQWGISVPNDPSQKVYVWFDALVNYLTSAGFAQFPTSNEIPTTSPWPATHVVGKDITKFHCIMWPAFLMAAGIELPKQVVVHSHWLSEGVKMSKSIGNVVDPVTTSKYYGTDVVRFFLCENQVLNGDGDFTEEKLHRTREQLISKYANLISRGCGAKFNMERAIKRFSNGEFSDAEELLSKKNKGLSELFHELKNQINQIAIAIDEDMTHFSTYEATQKFWDLIFNANQLMQDGEPWTYKPSPEVITKSKSDPLLYQDLYIFTCLEAARVASILIQPIMPELSQVMLDRLSVSPGKRNIDYASFGADLTYGVGINKSAGVLMQRIPIRESINKD